MTINSLHNMSVTDAVINRLESLIIEGVFKPGDSLPPERKLAKEFNVSRASLRQALSVLESRGLILSRQGGGNYICDIAKESFSDPLVDLMTRHHSLKFQIIELRQTLEGSAAFFAAQRATQEDRQNIRQRLKELEEIVPLQKPKDEAKADLELHLAIADAAHNAPLSMIIRNIYSLLLNEVEGNLALIHQYDINTAKLDNQHTVMAERVINGDSEGAQQVVIEHLELIKNTFIENGLITKETEVSETRTYLTNK